MEKQLQFYRSLIWPDKGLTPQTTTLEVSTLAVTPPMYLKNNDQNIKGIVTQLFWVVSVENLMKSENTKNNIFRKSKKDRQRNGQNKKGHKDL